MQFTFLTGVSTFTNVSLFSDLNNLTDFTLDAAYSSICGYTERDLDTGASSAAAREDPAPRWCVRPIEAGGLRLSATSTTASASPGRSPHE